MTTSAADRESLALPPAHEALVAQVAATGVPVVDCANAKMGATKKAPKMSRKSLRSMVPSRGLDQSARGSRYAPKKYSARGLLRKGKIDYPPAPRHADRRAIILPLSRPS